MNGIWLLTLGVPVLIVHLVAIMLTKALQSYSRSRLEEYTDAKGHATRADQVAHLDEVTERSSEAIALLSGFCLAGLAGLYLAGREASTALAVGFIVTLILGGVGYLLAGVFGRVFAEPIIDVAWPWTFLVRGLAWPLTQAMNAFQDTIEWMARDSETSPRPTSVEVEIPSEGEGSDDVEAELPEAARAMLQSAVELTRMNVSELMLPRASIVWEPSSVTSAEAAETFRKTGRSRMPLFGENRDDIIGVLLAKDLMEAMLTADEPESVVPAKLVRPAFSVPQTRNAFELLQDLRANRSQMAMVLDEYGGVAGLVTLEDLLEQLVGPIDDEHDVPTQNDLVLPLGGHRYEVDAALPLEDFNERFKVELPTDQDFETIGGLAFHALGHVPEPGALFRYQGIEFTILDVRDHSIRRVCIDLQPTAPALRSGTGS